MFLSLLWRSMMKPHFLHVRACLMLKFLLHSHALGFRNNGRSYLMLTRSQNSYLLWMYHLSSIGRVVNHHWTKTEVFIVDIFSKCDQIRIWIRNLRFWSHLLKKFIMKNLIFLSSACWSALLSVDVVQPTLLTSPTKLKICVCDVYKNNIMTWEKCRWYIIWYFLYSICRWFRVFQYIIETCYLNSRHTKWLELQVKGIKETTKPNLMEAGYIKMD